MSNLIEQTSEMPHYLQDGASGDLFYPILGLPVVFGVSGSAVERSFLAQAVSGKVIDAEARTAREHYGQTSVHWVRVAEPVSLIEIIDPPRRVISGYRLKDEAMRSTAFPLFLTVDGFLSLVDGDDKSPYPAIYAPEHGEEPGPRRVVDVSGLTPLVGGPASAVPGDWEVERVQGMIYGSLYHASLPGVLTGVEQMLKAAIVARFGEHDFYTHARPWSLIVSYDYDTPVFRVRPRTGRNGRTLKGTDRVAVRGESRIDFMPARHFTGASKADAYAKYKAYEADTLAWLDSFRPVACSHCKGDGVIIASTAEPKS